MLEKFDFTWFQATGNITGAEKHQAMFFYIQKFSPWLPPKVKRGIHQIHHSNSSFFA